MQSLNVISFNIWQVLISLANLLLLFLLVKKFLYKPVKKILAERKNEIEEQYLAAEAAEKAANESREKWESTLAGAESRADEIIREASDTAHRRVEKLVSDAKEEAGGILRKAEADAALEIKRAEQEIKREIVEVSGALSEKLLGREINKEDHKAFIDSFIDEIGDDNE